jgi:hypothetical protein
MEGMNVDMGSGWCALEGVVGQAPWLAISGRVPRGDAALMAVGH